MRFPASRCCNLVVFQVILLGFVATAICLSSQQLFILVIDRCHLRCSNGCCEITWNFIGFCLRIGDTTSEKMKCSKRLSMKMPWEKLRFWRFWVFRSPTMLHPTCVARNKTSNISQNHKRRRMSHFGNPWQVRLDVWNMLTNSKRGHEHVVEYG